MLKTLLYYEYRGLRRVGLLLLSLLLAAALGAMGVSILLTVLENADYVAFLYGLLLMLDLALFIAPILLLVVAYVLTIYRFYATVFTDEGYLTLMLPLPRATLLFGKMLSGVLFMTCVTLCTLLSYFISIGIPVLLYDVGTVVDVAELLWMLLTSGFIDTLGWVSFGITIADLLVRGLAAIVLGYAAVIIGGVVMRRHKLLGAIVFAIVIYYAREILDLILSLLVGLIFFNDISSMSSSYSFTVSILSFLLSCGVVVVGYLIAHRIFTRKLELE